MKTISLNLYQARKSSIHSLDPRAKIIVTVLVIFSNALLPDGTWLAFGITWGVLLGVTYLAGIPFKFLFSRSLIVLPFTFAAVTTIFSTPGTPLAALTYPPVTITIPGLIRFGSIMLRSWLSVQAAILLSATTPFPDLVHALRHLKIPPILVSIISFMYRYLFVLIDEAKRLLRARASRSARLPHRKGGGNLAWNAKNSGSLVGQLFLRSLERSERIYQAMQSRGFQGNLLTLNPHLMGVADWLALMAALMVLSVIQACGRWWA
ncbi:MAG: cobalt ECF transporter T component CbiQ [Anaerolineaceae bacterium 4572_5.2]|nr:MAG: cobalt ECF transporter T component CbiQ [Anaerolineaceae bacterium 4572_5.2]